MTVTINGTNGVSLCDTNSVPTAALQASAVTSAKLASGAPSRSQLPAGTVLQVVQGTYATETSTTSSSFVSTPLTVSITPTSSTSKVFVIASFPAVCATNGGKFTIYRNGANVVAAGLGELSNAAGDSCMTISYLDSPATTSATTYTMYMRTNGTGTTYFATNNYTSVITAFEVAA